MITNVNIYPSLVLNLYTVPCEDNTYASEMIPP